MKRIDIISDTHGRLSHSLLASLEGADLIIHAGDITSEADWEMLQTIAPIRAVLGNNDTYYYKYEPALKRLNTFEYEGLTFAVSHYREDLPVGAIDVGVCGHTHRARIAEQGRCLVINPGSATKPARFGDAHHGAYVRGRGRRSVRQDHQARERLGIRALGDTGARGASCAPCVAFCGAAPVRKRSVLRFAAPSPALSGHAGRLPAASPPSTCDLHYRETVRCTLQGFLPSPRCNIARNEPGNALRGAEIGPRVHCEGKCTARHLRFCRPYIRGFIAGFIAARNVRRPGQNRAAMNPAMCGWGVEVPGSPRASGKSRFRER